MSQLRLRFELPAWSIEMTCTLILAGIFCTGTAHGGTPSCPGDCGNDGAVSVDEVVIGVQIALGRGQVESCIELDTDGSGDVTVDELTQAVLSLLQGCSEPPLILSAWIFNPGNERSQHIFQDASRNLGVLVDVESASLVTDDSTGERLALIRTRGIPSYQRTLTEGEIEKLDARPNAQSDFRTGQTTAVAGVPIEFGQDIGYNSARGACGTTGGVGYWPPGPGCPQGREKEGTFPIEPRPDESATSCETGLGAIGYWVNGVSLFNWYDGQTYLGQRAWENLAPLFELYDLDICAGHAANGEYHHHSYPKCIAEILGDGGDGHSPLYGYVADGYPIYGPWEAPGVLAKSSWVERDYDDAASPTGCGMPSERTCLLVDPYDPTRGTMDATLAGPKTTDTVETLSRNEILAASGVYFQDYYYDRSLAALGGEYLDEHNGHSDGLRGYHYHVTVNRNVDSGELDYAFPGTVGPTYYGDLPDNGLTRCRGTGGPLAPDEHDHSK